MSACAALGKPGVLLQILECTSLVEWCALEAAAAWTQSVVQRTRCAFRASKHGIDSFRKLPWEPCKESDLVRLWLALGDNPRGRETEPSQNDTLLHIAVAARDGEGARQVLAWLLSRPGVAEMVQVKNTRGQTALHIAARNRRLNAARRIIRLPGVDVNAKDNYDSTALGDAIREEEFGMVKLLLEAHCDPNHFEDAYSRCATPLMLAVLLKNIPIARLLLETPGIDFHKAPNGRKAIDFVKADGPMRVLFDAAALRMPAAVATTLEDTCTVMRPQGTNYGDSRAHVTVAAGVANGSLQKTHSPDMNRAAHGWLDSRFVRLVAAGCGCGAVAMIKRNSVVKENEEHVAQSSMGA